MKKVIQTDKAPPCAGTYSQAIQAGTTVYLAGQIPLDPTTQQIVGGGMEEQTIRVFENLKAVVEAAGGSLNSIVRLGVFLTDLKNFPVLNETMQKYFQEPYPARTTVEVSALPKGSLIEIDGIMVV